MSEDANDGSPQTSPPDAVAEGAANDASTNVSHTSLTQMTSSPAPASEGSKWTCEVCTYENFPLSRKCTMCRSPKPALNEDIFRLQDGASALPTSDVCGAEAIAERLKPLRISSPQGAAASSGSKWPCPTCTYENWPKSLKCAMCGTNNPAPHAPHSPHTPNTPHTPHTPHTQHTQHSPHPALGINEICTSPPPSIHELDTSRCSKKRNTDWLWLQACLGVVEGSARCVEAYLSAGGDPARALTPPEVALLNRASAFDAGHTLVHLAIRFQRQEILSTLLSRISGGGSGLKRSPSYIAPDLASAIRRHIASCIRYKKGNFPCRYINEFCTFYLPAEIEELPGAIQEQLFSELLDRDVQSALEADPPTVNWSDDLTVHFGSRLYALWNRSAGDCLPDAVSQAAYGVVDRDNTLRAALADTLQLAQRPLYARWAAWERQQAARLHYAADEAQLRAEWARLVAAAARPGAPLHQLHVFVLAHVLRRPILVYGVDVVRSFRGEPLGYARFRGLYLPLLLERDACCPSPLCLGYTRGHFSALVPLGECRGEALLPLAAPPGDPLPVQFAAPDELDTAHRWLAPASRAGLLVLRQRLHARPLLQAQLLEEWLNHYRTLAQTTRGPFPPRLVGAEFSSDADTDEE